MSRLVAELVDRNLPVMLEHGTVITPMEKDEDGWIFFVENKLRHWRTWFDRKSLESDQVKAIEEIPISLRN